MRCRRQGVLTATAVEEIVGRTGQHVVLGGDFDTMPEAASIQYWRGLQSLEGTSVAYRDAWELTHGAEPGTPSLRRSCPWPHLGGGPTRIDGVWGSDHFGLVADLSPE